MDEYDDQYGFMIPETFLTQLGEYTRGYMLIVCNEKGELYAHESYDNPVIKLGLINFAEMHSAAALRHMHNRALKEEEEMEGFDDEDSDGGKDGH
jgi:hypothetical protein